jgi:hypothetical protein
MVWTDEARMESARVRHLKALLNAHRLMGRGNVKTLQHPISTHKLRKRTLAKGGFSYNPLSLEVPKKGHMVSIYPKRSKVIKAGDLKASDIRGYLEANRELLKRPGHYAGGWFDPETGLVWLDVSVVAGDANTAKQLCVENDQEGWYNLETGQTTYVAKEEREAWKQAHASSP